MTLRSFGFESRRLRGRQSPSKQWGREKGRSPRKKGGRAILEIYDCRYFTDASTNTASCPTPSSLSTASASVSVRLHQDCISHPEQSDRLSPDPTEAASGPISGSTSLAKLERRLCCQPPSFATNSSREASVFHVPSTEAEHPKVSYGPLRLSLPSTI